MSTEESSQTMRYALRHNITLLLLLGGLVSCESGLETHPAEPHSQAVEDRATPGRNLALAPVTAWRRLGSRDQYLVSPAWSPDGQWIAASGLSGQGLTVVSLATGHAQVVDPSYRGPRGWVGDLLCLDDHAGGVRAYQPARTRFVAKGCRRLWERPWDDAQGRLIHRSSARQWRHHPRLGRITLERTRAPAHIVAEQGAWGVRVSPDGQRVAWSTGTLAEPVLYLHDVASGKTRRLGTGAHPDWFPDARHLIFARPAGIVRRGGLATVSQSELVLHDARSGMSRALTATPDRAEMQPQVSPRADAVVFADWRTGVIWLAPFVDRGQP